MRTLLISINQGYICFGLSSPPRTREPSWPPGASLSGSVSLRAGTRFSVRPPTCPSRMLTATSPTSRDAPLPPPPQTAPAYHSSAALIVPRGLVVLNMCVCLRIWGECVCWKKIRDKLHEREDIFWKRYTTNVARNGTLGERVRKGVNVRQCWCFMSTKFYI